ncbi:hypothetical protein L1987_19550 [Smallanthus sonchifolius]|uniref:Uncharacterized protein n=1 Tax=Smallanthus sonchifolius TaxID=185202 RepID=A0ACB9IQ46_9ASTR|nr:hypothetical protein L1987_19550 [Smallanthus sonchifolius]
MLKVVASQDLWFWHAFFGVAGSNNDINVLNQSPLFNTLVNGTTPDSSFDLRDDGRAICEFNEEEFEATLGLEEVSEAQQSVNEQYKRNREIHNNLRQDLVLHLDSGNN